jgi:hypothetical protein
MTDASQETPPMDPLAGVLGALLPGAGHLYQGQFRRALLVGGGVLGLFFSGLLIGGIDAIDSRNDRLWFLGQMLVGPVAFGVDAVHQNVFKAIDPETGQRRSPVPGEVKDAQTGRWVPSPAGAQPPISKGMGKMNEIGTLYITVAGMLNLIVILDAAFPGPGRVRRRAF